MSTKKNYNNQDWEITISISNYLTNQSAQLAAEHLNFISIYNSIESYVPAVEIHYEDYNNEVLNLLEGNRNIYCCFNETTDSNRN
jgi:hypothetical protein